MNPHDNPRFSWVVVVLGTLPHFDEAKLPIKPPSHRVGLADLQEVGPWRLLQCMPDQRRGHALSPKLGIDRHVQNLALAFFHLARNQDPDDPHSRKRYL